MEILLYFLLGSFSGVLAGLFGIGGGIIIIPSFFYIFAYLGFPEEILSHMVLGSSLGVIVFSSVSSTYSHNAKEAVKPGEIYPMILIAILFLLSNFSILKSSDPLTLALMPE